MNNDEELVSSKGADQYVHGMDWLSGELEEFELSNYSYSAEKINISEVIWKNYVSMDKTGQGF